MKSKVLYIIGGILLLIIVIALIMYAKKSKNNLPAGSSSGSGGTPTPPPTIGPTNILQFDFKKWQPGAPVYLNGIFKYSLNKPTDRTQLSTSHNGNGELLGTFNRIIDISYTDFKTGLTAREKWAEISRAADGHKIYVLTDTNIPGVVTQNKTLYQIQ